MNSYKESIYTAAIYSSPYMDIKKQHIVSKTSWKIYKFYFGCWSEQSTPHEGGNKTDENGKALLQYLLQSPHININIGPTRFTSILGTASQRTLLSPTMSNKLAHKDVNKKPSFRPRWNILTI